MKFFYIAVVLYQSIKITPDPIILAFMKGEFFAYSGNSFVIPGNIGGGHFIKPDWIVPPPDSVDHSS